MIVVKDQLLLHLAQHYTLHPWIWPAKPWQRIHIDFAGPFMEKMFFIVVDAHSKWPEVILMTSTSNDFQHFMTANGVKHIKCSPYHPSSNGLAECFVRTFKQAMKAGESDGTTLNHRLSNFLLSYRTTTHATTNRSPSSLFLQREIYTRLDLLQPTCNEHVFQQQTNQQKQHDQHAKTRDFEPGQAVMIRNYRGNPKWLTGHTTRVCSSDIPSKDTFRAYLEEAYRSTPCYIISH